MYSHVGKNARISPNDEQGKLDGEAEVHYNNGDYFSGHFKHGSIEGEGSLLEKTGDKFLGIFSSGLLTGLVREELDKVMA